MRKRRVVITLVCFLVGCGLLAAVNFIPVLKNAKGYGKVYEWAGVCLVGTASLAGAMAMIGSRAAPLLPAEMWRKHRPVKDRLPNVHIGDMMRAERQFVLYGDDVNLAVLLAILMYDNRLNEDDICRNLGPLIEYHNHNIWQYFPGILVKQQKQQQVKQRENLVRNVLSAIDNAVISRNHKNNIRFPDAASDNSSQPPEASELTGYIVHTVIGMRRDGHRMEDIVEAFNAGPAKRRGTKHQNTKQPIDHNDNGRILHSS